MNNPHNSLTATPALYSINKLGEILSYPPTKLRELARQAPEYYHPFPRKKPDGSYRTIHNPTGTLKQVQKKIHDCLLLPIAMPSHLHGGVRGRSIRTNARRHVGKGMVIAIDIKQFFPSITEQHIYKIWKYRLNCGTDAARLLTLLTAHENQLPQGSAASTALANLALFNAEQDLQRAFAEKGLALLTDTTRFVDDITISGAADPTKIIATVIGILRRHGFRCKRDKLRVMFSSSPQIITNLLVNAKISLTKAKRREIRATVHRLEKMPLNEQRRHFNSAIGQVNFLHEYHKREGDHLLARLHRIKESFNVFIIPT